jgi:hypothetical protein
VAFAFQAKHEQLKKEEQERDKAGALSELALDALKIFETG